MTHQLKTRKAAQKAFASAEMYKVFQPLDVEGVEPFPSTMWSSVGPFGGWDVFGITPTSGAVRDELYELGIETVDFEPQRDDAQAPPDGYDDFDAAVDALLAGWWLCKVPENLGD
ncbi:MAG: hypothetical protein V3S01_05990, partial [Dehalococcoidia bacterium]